MDKMAKRSLKLWISAAILAITIIVNIIVACQPVFKGSPYKASQDGVSLTLTFSDDMVTERSSKEGTEKNIYFVTDGIVQINGSYRSFLKRESIFVLRGGKEGDGVVFVCAGAIVLQVFFCVVILACAIQFFKELIWQDNERVLNKEIENSCDNEDEKESKWDENSGEWVQVGDKWEYHDLETESDEDSK